MRQFSYVLSVASEVAGIIQGQQQALVGLILGYLRGVHPTWEEGSVLGSKR